MHLRNLLKASVVLLTILVSYCLVAYASNPIRIFVNGKELYPDVPAQNIDGRVMVPIRFVGEALGTDVNWDSQNNSVLIQQSDNNVDKDRLLLYSDIDGYIEILDHNNTLCVEILKQVAEYYYAEPHEKSIYEDSIPKGLKLFENSYTTFQSYENININSRLAAYGYTFNIDSVKLDIKNIEIIAESMYNNIKLYGPSYYDPSTFNNLCSGFLDDLLEDHKTLINNDVYFHNEYISYVNSL